MAYSKVAYGGHTLIDLTQDTAVESDVASGKWFHKANGDRVQGTATHSTPAFNHAVAVTIDVVDGTYQLSLALNYRTTDSTDVKWATMEPEEHEEDGYYTYTANVNLCTGSSMDGFFLTESSGYDLDSGYMTGKTYIEVYHSGNTRIWYFFVPSDASTYNIVFTP